MILIRHHMLHRLTLTYKKKTIVDTPGALDEDRLTLTYKKKTSNR